MYMTPTVKTGALFLISRETSPEDPNGKDRRHVGANELVVERTCPWRACDAAANLRR